LYNFQNPVPQPKGVHPMSLRNLLAIVCVSVLLTGCGGGSSVPSGGGSTNDLPSLTNQLVSELKKVNDEASAKAARPKLEAIADKIDALQEKTKSGKADVPKNPNDFANRQMEAMKAYTEELTRISANPAAAKELQGMIKKLAP
jgi:hypothetical protein